MIAAARRALAVTFAALGLAASGCATAPAVESEARAPAPRQRAAPAPPPAPVSRWAALARELADGLGRTRGCGEVARVVRGFVSSRGKEYASLQVEVARWERQATTASVESFYREVFPDLDVRIDAGIRCKDDAQARAAYDQFFASAGLDTRRAH